MRITAEVLERALARDVIQLARQLEQAKQRVGLYAADATKEHRRAEQAEREKERLQRQYAELTNLVENRERESEQNTKPSGEVEEEA